MILVLLVSIKQSEYKNNSLNLRIFVKQYTIFISNMKTRIIIAAALLAICTTLSAADGKEQKIKTGWNFGVLPAVSYNSDLGLQYGVTADIFNYGDGSDFPRYNHKFTTEISHYTKGMTRLHLFYDSKHLIPGVRVTAAATYMNNPMFSFYGFNGSVQEYLPGMNANKNFFPENPANVHKHTADGVAYYNFQRNMFRFLADFQGQIAPNFNWAAGASFWSFDIKDIDNPAYESSYTLYDFYKDKGVIKPGEANGGNRLEMKAGVVYDSRDLDSAPSKGIWAEVYVNGSPDVFGDGYKYLKLSAHWRQYIQLISNSRLVFAYHLGYQGTVAGEVPFYMQSNITTLYLRQILSEGLGSINTVRGTLYNRMIGDSYAWGNFELRLKLCSFNFINQSWYLVTNPFFDLGAIVKPYRLEEQAKADVFLSNKSLDELTKEATKLHKSVGAGLKFVMNQNFIVGVEVGKCLNPEDNPGLGVNIGLNHIF